VVAVLHIGRQQKNASVDSIAQDSNQGEICRDVISDTLASKPLASEVFSKRFLKPQLTQGKNTQVKYNS